MSQMQQALKARLIADAEVGSAIHWNAVPQATPLPYIRLQTISEGSERTMEGYQPTQRTRVQVDCFAASWGQARENANKIKTLMAGPDTVSGVRFGKCGATGPEDLGEDVPGGKFIHRARLDLLVEFSLI